MRKSIKYIAIVLAVVILIILISPNKKEEIAQIKIIPTASSTKSSELIPELVEIPQANQLSEAESLPQVKHSEPEIDVKEKELISLLELKLFGTGFSETNLSRLKSLESEVTKILETKFSKTKLSEIKPLIEEFSEEDIISIETELLKHLKFKFSGITISSSGMLEFQFVELRILRLLTQEFSEKELEFARIKTEFQKLLEAELSGTGDSEANLAKMKLLESELETLLGNKSSDIMNSRDKMIEIFKADALVKWGSDYQMVSYEISQQTEAYDWVISQANYSGILDRARQKWSNDYTMVKYEYENQLEAYLSL